MKTSIILIFVLFSGQAFAEGFGLDSSILFHSTEPSYCINEQGESAERQASEATDNFSPDTILIEENRIKFISIVTTPTSSTTGREANVFVTTINFARIVNKAVRDDGNILLLTYLIADNYSALFTNGLTQLHPNQNTQDLRYVELNLELGVFKVLNLPHENCVERNTAGTFRIFKTIEDEAL